MSWYEISCNVIRSVIASNPHLERKSPEMRKLANKAYPFGDRRMWPYKMWLKAMYAMLGPSEKKKAAQATKLAEPHARIDQAALIEEDDKNV